MSIRVKSQDPMPLAPSVPTSSPKKETPAQQTPVKADIPQDHSKIQTASGRASVTELGAFQDLTDADTSVTWQDGQRYAAGPSCVDNIGRNPYPNTKPIYIDQKMGKAPGITSTPLGRNEAGFYRLNAVYDFHRAPDAPDLTFVITPNFLQGDQIVLPYQAGYLTPRAGVAMQTVQANYKIGDQTQPQNLLNHKPCFFPQRQSEASNCSYSVCTHDLSLDQQSVSLLTNVATTEQEVTDLSTARTTQAIHQTLPPKLKKIVSHVYVVGVNMDEIKASLLEMKAENKKSGKKMPEPSVELMIHMNPQNQDGTESLKVKLGLDSQNYVKLLK